MIYVWKFETEITKALHSAHGEFLLKDRPFISLKVIKGIHYIPLKHRSSTSNDNNFLLTDIHNGKEAGLDFDKSFISPYSILAKQWDLPSIQSQFIKKNKALIIAKSQHYLENYHSLKTFKAVSHDSIEAILIEKRAELEFRPKKKVKAIER